MTDPKTIYLQPECCADPEVGRLWCEDDAPEVCEDGVPWTKYVLASERAKQNAATNVGIDWANPATLNGVLCHAVQAEPVAVGHDGKYWPHTLDAKAWADEFCRRNTATDHGTMIGWFANAIEFARAHDAAPPAAQGEPVANAMRCDFCNINFADRQPGTVCPKCYRELSRIVVTPPADDEAVRLLKRVSDELPLSNALLLEVDTYLEKVGK